MSEAISKVDLFDQLSQDNTSGSRRYGRVLVELAVIGCGLAGIPQLSEAETAPAPAEQVSICVVRPDVPFGQKNDARTNPSIPVTDALIKYLSNPLAEVKPIELRVDGQGTVTKEALQTGCSYVVDAYVSHEQGGMDLESLLSATSALSKLNPYVGSGGGGDGYATTAMASAGLEGIASTEQEELLEEILGLTSLNIKEGDRVVIEYTVNVPGQAAPILQNKREKTAETDGQDVLTALIEQIASDVLLKTQAPAATGSRTSSVSGNDKLSPADDALGADEFSEHRVSASQVPRQPALPKDSPLAAAWDHGNLPVPGSRISGDLDAAAVRLAMVIASRADESLVAMVDGLLASGVAIQRENGELALPVKAGSPPILLAEWQVAAIGKQYSKGAYVPLSAIGDVLHSYFPDADSTEIARRILLDIENAAQSEEATERFWGRFIIALSKGSEAQTNQTSFRSTDPSTVNLDPIQAALVMGRLTRDLLAQEKQQSISYMDGPSEANSARFVGPQKERHERTGHSFESLMASVPSTAAYWRQLLDWLFAAAHSAPPCQFGEIERKILETHQLGTKVGFKILIDYLGSAAKTAGRFFGAATGMLDMLETVLHMAALKIDLSMAGEPLERTKSSETDEHDRWITAKVRLDTDSYQWVNCLAPALNLFGMDLKAANSSKRGGARITWEVVEGDELFGIKTGNRVENKFIGYLDSNGTHRIVATGLRQKCRVAAGAPPVDKQGAISAAVAPKDIRDASDFVWIFTRYASGFASLGPMGAVTNFIDSLAYTDWLTSQRLEFSITDWLADPRLIVRKEKHMNYCVSGVCTKADSSATAIVQLSTSDKDCSLSGDAIMSDEEIVDVLMKGPVAGYARGDSAESVRVGVEATLDAQSNTMRVKLKMSSAGSRGQISGTVRGYSETVDDHGEAWNSNSCGHEMCTGFELPFEQGATKEWVFPIPGGQQKYSVLLEQSGR